MKVGCLAVLLAIGGAFAAYRDLLTGTVLEDKLWIGGILAVMAGMIVGNIHGLLLALNQKKASGKQRSEWVDGELVVVSGRIQSTRSPMVSPFSATPCVLLEYQAKSGESGSRDATDYRGFMMSPCSIYTTQGSVNVVGFPLLTKLSPTSLVEDIHYQRAGEFFKQVTFQEQVANPFELLKQINQVFSKDAGEVQAHFSDGKSILDLESQDASQLTTQLLDEGINLEETLIPNGAEVTVSGTYRANRQAIDISGGLTNLSHSLELGSSSKVTGANIYQSLIWLIVLSGAFGAANYFLLKELGLLSKFAIGS